METTAVTDSSPAAPTSPDPEPAPGSPVRRTRLAWLAAALLGIWAAVATFALVTGNGTDTRHEVELASIEFVTELTNWDASAGLDETIAGLREMGTGEFLSQIEDVLSAEARATAEAVGATSRGEIVEVFTTPIDGDRAVSVVIVRQTLTVDGESAVQEQISRMEFLRVDGRWLVARSEILNAPSPLGTFEEGEE